jgi:hypothetical protein
MSAVGYTPIQLYYSATTTNVPSAGNLAAGELAINTADGLLFFKDSGGTVTTLATKNYVDKSTAQTLTNKTLTTPVISGTPSATAQYGYDATSNVPTYYNSAVVMKLGYLGIPQNSKSAAYTLVISDAGAQIFHPSADTTARTWTIPANSSVAFDIGTAVTFINQNAAGVITIAITSDTMRLAGAGTTGSRTLAANGIATAVKVTSTEWIISGTGLT